MIPICNEKLDNFTITQTDVLRELLSLDYNKASGPSEILNLLLKKCPQIFSKILYQLFQKILISGIIPDKLKIVSVTPILKKGKPINEISSYRPITVENNLLKLFEKLIFNNINAHIVKNDLIPDSQYGFRAGLNTQNQLIDLLYEISIGLNDPNVLCIDVVFLNYSNAFDRVSFGLLLENLYTIGIIGQSLAIISSLLYGRNFYVIFKAVISVLVSIMSGVPQGGVCSALLFNIFVRNLALIIIFSKLFQYADDCALKKSFIRKVDKKSFNKI